MDIGIEKAEIRKPRRHLKWLKPIVLLLFCFIVILSIPVLRVQFKYKSRVVSGDSIVPPNIGLVVSTGENELFENKLAQAIKLFQDGKIGRLIVSGDNSSIASARLFAADQGLPEDTIMPDNAKNIFESCSHVRDNFGLSRVIIISQKSNLRRSLFVCNESGLTAWGVVAVGGGMRYNMKEFISSVGDLIESFR
ncbi:MAG: ElyC/SanA/YdcF family protein [Parcubacteria group bacterium]